VYSPRKSKRKGAGSRVPGQGAAADRRRTASPADEQCRGAEASLAHLEGLLRRSLEDSAFCGVTWHKFVARAGDLAGALRRAFKSGNAAALAREAQTLQEVAAALAESGLQAVADELARAASRGGKKQVGRALERCCAEIDRCAAEAAAILAPTRPANGAVKA
jgi:hypothetical protein